MLQEILEFVTRPELFPFSSALVLMIGLGVVSAIGIDFEPDLDVGGDPSPDPAGLGPINWINPGKMPMLAALALFLLIYGLMGYAGQQITEKAYGAMLPSLAAGIIISIPAYLTWNAVSRFVGRILPRDHSEATLLSGLKGRKGEIQTGVATNTRAASAMFKDHYGTRHYLMVHMALPGEQAAAGEAVYLLEQGAENTVIRVEPKEPVSL